MRVAVFSTESYDEEYLFAANRGKGHEMVFYKPALNRSTAGLAYGFEAVCVFVHDQIDRSTLEQLKEGGVKLVALRCAGFNNVDLVAAHELGIPIVRVPAYSPHAVAEHAVALILTLNRKTHKAYNRVREGNFSLERLTGYDLHRKKVGVVGTGKIGSAFAEIMLGFGCRVTAFDKYPQEYLKEKGVRYVSLEQLFSESDIISLHCPLTPETHKIINRDTIGMMKKGVMIINTSRGKLISSSAMLRGLRDRKIGYLGIDVYSQEENLFYKDLSEIIIDDEVIGQLMTFPNVLITAHQAFFTREALEEIAVTTIRNLDDFQQRGVLENEVKTDVMR